MKGTMQDRSAGDDHLAEVHFGPHLFRWEPPDLGHILYDGTVDGAMVNALYAQTRRFLLLQPRVFMLVDLTRLSRISAEARKLSAEGSKGLNLRGVAIVGASPLMRVVAGLVSRAVELMGNRADNPTRFFETEREARAWIAARRGSLPESVSHP